MYLMVDMVDWKMKLDSLKENP